VVRHENVRTGWVVLGYTKVENRCHLLCIKAHGALLIEPEEDFGRRQPVHFLRPNLVYVVYV